MTTETAHSRLLFELQLMACDIAQRELSHSHDCTPVRIIVSRLRSNLCAFLDVDDVSEIQCSQLETAAEWLRIRGSLVDPIAFKFAS